MNHLYLNNLYSKRYLETMLETFNAYKNNKAVEEAVTELTSNYNVLEKSYRNEYFYKNSLFNKIVLGKHSLNTTYALNEVTISKSKADMVIVNNNQPIVYEIKTELDNFDKLAHQIDDYFKISSKVYVVTAESTYYPLYRILKNSDVGIYILTKRNTLSLKKQANENNGFLEYNALFKLLRKNEYENIIMEYYGFKPKVNAFQYYTECLRLFEQIDILDAKILVFKELKKRESEYEKQYINLIPYELRWLVYSCQLKESSYQDLSVIFKK